MIVSTTFKPEKENYTIPNKIPEMNKNTLQLQNTLIKSEINEPKIFAGSSFEYIRLNFKII